jgi:hypothetical protein
MGFDNQWRFRDCPHCGVKDAQMNLVGQLSNEVPRAGQSPTWWTVLACPRCGGVVAVEHNAPSRSDNAAIRTMPEGDENLTGIRHLPAGIKRTYEEAVRALRADLPSSAAVQLRRTLEGAAAHQGITGQPLVTSIAKMIDQGLVTPSFAKVLHHVRLVGNQGAHYTDAQLTEQQVQQALRFTSALLRNVFEVPGDLDELEQDEDVDTDVAEGEDGDTQVRV